MCYVIVMNKLCVVWKIHFFFIWNSAKINKSKYYKFDEWFFVGFLVSENLKTVGSFCFSLFIEMAIYIASSQISIILFPSKYFDLMSTSKG